MDASKWHAVVAPPLELVENEKEPGTQGRVFLLRCNERHGFLSQSLPALVRWLNTQRSDSRKFLVSSFYRVVRLKQQCHLGWTACSFKRGDLTSLNAALVGVDKLIFLTRDPDSWRINLPEGDVRPPTPGCESDPG